MIAVRMTLLFAFAQSVHYGVWLRMIPDEDRERTAPRTFGNNLDAVARDLTWPVVVVATLLAAAVMVYGIVDSVGARDGYLRLATFHGPMELALLALFSSETREKP